MPPTVHDAPEPRQNAAWRSSSAFASPTSASGVSGGSVRDRLRTRPVTGSFPA